ncbi:MAG TPA: cold shock domain-containing protein, partial [Rhizomicrobium sp.]|nr:cold shock domain-containing protein [Rhizomicrobium sp.]
MAYGNEGPKPISQASAKGKVKWFNATKGYGFITLDNGGDAFCHASALQATGHSDVPPGTTIVCDLADSQRGLQVV